MRNIGIRSWRSCREIGQIVMTYCAGQDNGWQLMPFCSGSGQQQQQQQQCHQQLQEQQLCSFSLAPEFLVAPIVQVVAPSSNCLMCAPRKHPRKLRVSAEGCVPKRRQVSKWFSSKTISQQQQTAAAADSTKSSTNQQQQRQQRQQQPAPAVMFATISRCPGRCEGNAWISGVNQTDQDPIQK